MRNSLLRPDAIRGFKGRSVRLGARLGTAILLAGAVGVGLTGEVQKAHAGSVSAKTVKSKRSWFEIGKASWYGGKFNGRRTALGERFDMHALTCAHRTLPLGSWVRVTNLHNRRSVFLRVNDRGPMSEDLAVDLSYSAAQRLGISGLGNVRIEAVRKDDPALVSSLHPPAPKPQYLEIASNAEGVPILPSAVAFR